ncbi:hypothetical protein C8J57DRAFT_1482478 [Mycena rebaudengoi]|nr:hypothetical protein C8J57DRAFT_1482478 [Mycena rebaudengoi]
MRSVDDDEMDQDDPVAAKTAPATRKKASAVTTATAAAPSKAKASGTKGPDTSKSKGNEKGGKSTLTARKFLPRVADASDSDSEYQQPPPLPQTRAPTGRSGLKTKHNTDTDIDDDNLVLSADDGPTPDPLDEGNISSDDDILKGTPDDIQEQLLSERPQFTGSSGDREALIDYARPSTAHRWQRSSSSVAASIAPSRAPSRASSTASHYGVPVDTDFDDDGRDEPSDSEEDERRLKIEDAADAVSAKSSKAGKPSAQQLKYDEEKPQMRTVGTVTAESKPERAWPQSTHIVWPSKGGGLKLRDQNNLMQAVLKESMEGALCNLIFDDSYPTIESRPKFCQTLIRKAAKKIGTGATPIGKRAKHDLDFCASLASLILTRASNLRADIKNSATSRVAVHYEFNKTGTTDKDIRKITRLLLANQQYIFPYREAPAASKAVVTAAANTDEVDTADNDDTTAAAPSTPEKPIKLFKLDLPFHAPAISDVIHDVFFRSGKSLGHKYLDRIVSTRTDRPREKVLPEPLVCVVSANIWAAIVAWKSGRHVAGTEFSQALLEGAYRKHMDDMKDMRTGNSKKTFHKLMHELFVKASQTRTGFITGSGSAANIVTLAIDDDSE